MSKVIFNGIELNGTQALPELTYAEYDAIPDAVKPEYWILKDDALSEDKVSITASSDTWRTALMKLYALVDISRVNTKSMLGVWESDAIGEKLYTVHVINKKTGQINFTRPTAYTSVTTETMFIFPNVVYMYANTSDVSNTSVADGMVFTLYYNTATLGQINTKAENCIYGNSNVKDALDDISAATVSSSTYPTYNAQFASEFSSGSPDNLALYTLSNGMRVMNGIFLVTAQATAADILFYIPDSYSYPATGYLGQNWLSAVNIITQESYTIRVNNKAYPWGADIPVGTYRIHAVF